MMILFTNSVSEKINSGAARVFRGYPDAAVQPVARLDAVLCKQRTRYGDTFDLETYAGRTRQRGYCGTRRAARPGLGRCDPDVTVRELNTPLSSRDRFSFNTEELRIFVCDRAGIGNT